MNLEFNKVIVFSTGHITAEDNQRLADMVDAKTPGVYDHGHEYLIWVAHVETEQMSDAYKGLAEFAIMYNCEWLRLDRDGPVYANLPRFEW